MPRVVPALGVLAMAALPVICEPCPLPRPLPPLIRTFLALGAPRLSRHIAPTTPPLFKRRLSVAAHPHHLDPRPLLCPLFPVVPTRPRLSRHPRGYRDPPPPSGRQRIRGCCACSPRIARFFRSAHAPIAIPAPTGGGEWLNVGLGVRDPRPSPPPPVSRGFDSAPGGTFRGEGGGAAVSLPAPGWGRGWAVEDGERGGGPGVRDHLPSPHPPPRVP